MKANNWKVLVVDDEVLICETLRDYLQLADIQNIRLAHDFEAAMTFIRFWNPDLVLLDIRLDAQEEGIVLGEYLLNESGIPFMYVTAQSDLNSVNKIIQTKPVAYLTKPINKAQFIISIQTFFNQLEQLNAERISKALKSDIQLPEKDILYLQASGNYWELNTVNGRQLLRSTYEEIRKDFPEERFVRIHRSYIVNISAIEQLSSTKIRLTNGQELPVSRSYQSAVKNITIV